MPSPSPHHRYILASRSPQRRQLLGLLVPETSIDVVPPASPDERGFDGLTTWAGIRERLQLIAHDKLLQVQQQLGPRAAGARIIAADTTVIIETTALAADSPDKFEHGAATPPADRPLAALGQPPSDETWPDVVRGWFLNGYAGRTHWVATGLWVATPSGAIASAVDVTAVTMRSDVDRWLDWYLTTGESRGKAGGYALQGAGSLFVTRTEGSLSNIVGLPLEQLKTLLER